MHTTTILTAAILTTTTLALALPTTQTPVPRGLPGAVYVCTGSHFSGDCMWLPPSPKCHIPGSGANVLNSIGPDEGGYCVLYGDAECEHSKVGTVSFPGTGQAVSGRLGSLRCWASTVRVTAPGPAEWS